MPTKDQQRQHANLAFLDSGAEFSFGDASALPLPLAELLRLDERSAGVEAVMRGGLTALVYKLKVGEQTYAVKRARPACLVQNDDERTSFLNELQRHAELHVLRMQGAKLPGIAAPLYGSLRAGLLVTPWIAGVQVDDFDERRLRQLFAAGRALLLHGCFEWDYSPGNLLDDGAQCWLFDFGYQYRFDPLSEFNSAGDGRDVPQFHLAERIETRAAFAWLLRVETSAGLPAALKQYRMLKEVALDCYRDLQRELARQNAQSHVLAWLAAIMARWQEALHRGGLERLYYAEGWRSHSLDLADDLHGQTCTPQTLARADWLIAMLEQRYPALVQAGALAPAQPGQGRAALLRRFRAYRASAAGLQVDGKGKDLPNRL